MGDDTRVAGFPNGGGLASEDAWVLAEGTPERALGAALAWTLRQGSAALHLLLSFPTVTPEIAGVVARRAALFALPTDVWLVDGRDLIPAKPSPPPRLGVLPPEGLVRLRERIRAAGADPVYEQGTLTGEVLGLEVCRAVPDDDSGWRLAVGVGKYDREIHDVLRAGGDAGANDALRRVIREVREHRRLGAGAHPANSLAPERWLRAVVVAHPDLVGARSLQPIETTQPRTDLRQTSPAAAMGEDGDGRPVLVVCTAGAVDLEAIPIAADTRLALAGDPRLVLVADSSADARITRDLAGALCEPAAVAVVPADWRGLDG